MSDDPLLQEVTTRLQQAFSPAVVTVYDESAQHAGHLGHQGGRHLAVSIASPALQSWERVPAHRAIYTALADLIPLPIHALRIIIC